MSIINLVGLKASREAVVVNIVGGVGARRKLENLGVRIGSTIVKKSSAQGPVVINCGNTQIAIGRGLASKIIVKEL